MEEGKIEREKEKEKRKEEDIQTSAIGKSNTHESTEVGP